MKRLLLLLVVVAGTIVSRAQLLTWTPAFPKDTDNITITVDVTKGNAGLLGFAGPVFVHVGAITSLSTGPTNWLHVPFTWGSTQPAAQAVAAGPNKWSFTINNPRTFFNLAAGEQLKAIAILFRSGGCTSTCLSQRNADGSDMYVPVYDNSLAIRFTDPPMQPRYVPVPEPINKNVGDNLSITAISSAAATLKLFLNGTLIQTATGATTISANPVLTTSGNQMVIAEADNGTSIKRDTLQFFVSPAITIAPLPTGMKEGINYQNSTTVTLVLNAPFKTRVSVIGEFPGSNWTEQAQYIMNKTPDGKYWWLQITGLTPGTEYAYQYLVDGNLKVADPYTEKILDPANDPQISAATYPGLRAYPAGQTGIVSVLRTNEPAYTWAVTNFNKPDKRSLVIYELLVRDFVAAHDFKTITDSLNYFKKLGINAIEVMPFNEFENNDSWGYNSDFYFAPDKYYGPKNLLKAFIDSCHSKGIAVIMDIVMNHSYGPSPLARLYWDGANNRPAANNPWYNPVQPHAFGFGDDFNHESQDTKNFFNRVLQHWITEYKIDGYRFDFSKGLTQKPSTNDAQFSAYDASRIAIINGYANAIKAVDPNSYIILEHFADNTEEKQLADSGMLIWGLLHHNYAQASMGHPTDWDFSWGIHSVRGWTKPHLVTYMESHDEERIVYKNITSGNASGSYNIKDTTTALKRMELNAAFMLTVPGPKMIWQFGELGYSHSIFTCTNGTVDPNCKLGPKPIRWDFLNDARRKNVFTVYSKLINLRFHPLYKDAFMSGIINRDLSGAIKWITVNSGDTSRLVVVGNFGVTGQTGNVTFPAAGTWYDYLNNTIYIATGTTEIIGLAPGEYRVYVNRNVNNVATTPVINVPWNGQSLQARAFPNPTSGKLTIDLQVPQSQKLTMDLYNALGQYVTTLYRGFLVRGAHNIPVEKQGALPGNYYITIRSLSATTTIPVTFQ